ncbi:MAG: hypothetical protein ACFFEJ_06635 [Candidatus Thorarchaeota archaeon]
MLLMLMVAIVSFAVVIIFMPGTIKLLKEKGKIGIDVHKPDRPEIPKGGGFVFLFAIVSSILAVIGVTTFLNGETNLGLLAALVSILMAGMVGLLDDNLDFRNRTKVVLPIVASIPIMAMQVGTTTMSIPFIGTLDLGILYPLLVVPLMMTFIIDSTNMYGGMNGLEATLAGINASAIVLFVFLRSVVLQDPITSGQNDAGIVAAALLGATLGFLIFNWYPAKVLPGDVGRLALGATVASALILGNMDRLAVMLYAPFMLNFILYIIYRIYVKRKDIGWTKFATPREDGTLEVVGPFTIYWLLPWLSKQITERTNVIALAILQAVLAYGTVLVLIFPIF